MNFTTLEIERKDAVAWIWMNKPNVHNAFDEVLIAELTSALDDLDADGEVRVIVLAGRGKSFSAGADLNWMRRQGAASLDDNVADATKLAVLFRTLAECATPTLASVHGAALGGGVIALDLGYPAVSIAGAVAAAGGLLLVLATRRTQARRAADACNSPLRT